MLVVGACVEVHLQQVLRWHSGAGGVELQFANGDARAVCAQITKSKDSAAVRDADESNVFLRPILQNVFHLATPRDRQIHATRLAVDMTEFHACFADGRVVNNREKARRVRHDRCVEERFVVVEQIHEINITVEIGILLAQLHHHALQLQFWRFRYVGNEAHKAERLLFGLTEGGRLVERWILKQFNSAFGGASHIHYLLSFFLTKN